MYCTHCECPDCRAIRLNQGDSDTVKKDVTRLIIKAGKEGMTAAELARYSRPLRALGKKERALMFDQLMAEGVLIKHRFKTTGLRGKARDAYLCSEI